MLFYDPYQNPALKSSETGGVVSVLDCVGLPTETWEVSGWLYIPTDEENLDPKIRILEMNW